MVVAISVVVHGKDYRPLLDDFVESLDQQTLATDTFEVVVVDGRSSDGTRERWRQLSSHRPNVRLLEHAGENNGPGASWLDDCAGEFVLRLAPDQRLFARALEQLVGYAGQHDLDVVSCRVVQPGTVVPDVLLADSSDVESEQRGAALGGPAVLVRRELLTSTDERAVEERLGAARVGVFSSYPLARQQAAAPTEGAPVRVTLSAATPALGWRHDRLNVRLSGTVADLSTRLDLGGARVLCLLRHDSGLTFPVERSEPLTAVTGIGLGPDWSWELESTLDLASVAGGEPLPAGVWEIDLQLVGVDAFSEPVTLGWTACPPAVVQGAIFVPAPQPGPVWQLDVGPTRWPLVAGIDPAEGSVVESAAGSMMVLQLPGVHVSGESSVVGEIMLDRLPLAAQLVCDQGVARVEAYVSGLAGAPRLQARFGEAPMQQTGLCLEISGTGQMTLARVQPAPSKAASPAKPSAKKSPAKPSPTAKKASPAKKAPPEKPTSPAKKVPLKPLTRTQHLRRAVPEQLEPLVKRAAKSPVARELYRRIARL